MSSGAVRSSLGLLSEQEGEGKTEQQWFDLFYKGWFSSKVSTEPMMRGTANENAVLSALRAMQFVKGLFEVGMLALKDARYLACSPDALALINMQSFDEWEGDGEGITNDAGEVVVCASVEIKTRVSPISLGEAVRLSSPDIVRCEVGDETFRKYVPREHMAQVLHQLVVLRLRFAIYVCAAETGILYTVIIRFPAAVLQVAEAVLVSTAGPIVSWAYETNVATPAFVNVEYRQTVSSRLKFGR